MFQRKPACGGRDQLICAMLRRTLQTCKTSLALTRSIPSTLHLQDWDNRNETVLLSLEGICCVQPHLASFQVSGEMCRGRCRIHVPFLPLCPTRKSCLCSWRNWFQEYMISQKCVLPRIFKGCYSYRRDSPH